MSFIDEDKRSHTLKWYYKNREQQIQKNREWKIKNREHMLLQKKKYQKENRELIEQRKKKYRITERAKELKKKDDAKYYAKNKTNPIFLEKKHKRNKEYSKRPDVRARANMLDRIRRKENPRSARRQNDSIEIQIAMNNVRKRDKNTCQWQGCGLTFRQVPIHVHHIFPRSEYPDLVEIEQYMICYCANHHGLWHRFRGDSYSEMILARYQENGILSNEVIY